MSFAEVKESFLETANVQVSQNCNINPLEKIKQEIENFKEAHEQLKKDQQEISEAHCEHLYMTGEFRQRTVRLRQQLQEEQEDQARDIADCKNKLLDLQEMECRLKAEEQKVKEDLCCIKQLDYQLRQQTQVSTAMPEKTVVFTGDMDAGTDTFDLKSQIFYPMEGGTALLTFADMLVAQNILRKKKHDIKLGECKITLEAKPVVFLAPSHIEVDTHVCPRRVLVSNLPKVEDVTRLLDRLDVHFSKSRNGGSEVESVSILQDSGSAVITFLQDNVAKGLTDIEYHEVDLIKKKHKLRVTPFVNGEIADLKTRVSVSAHSVLLTGIPNIMDSDILQDCLEIHFQKNCNGGGEVDAFVYNPMDNRTLAIFEEKTLEDQ